MQLIYDHLEDSVFAPKSCQYLSCTKPQCDGSECYTSFAYSDFEQAETYFNNNILSFVENVKLDCPADSLPPLTRSSYVAQQADWGESEDALDTSWWDDQEQLWQEDTFEFGEEKDRGEEVHEDEDDDTEEAYATHMEVDQEDQPQSEEEDDDSYE